MQIADLRRQGDDGDPSHQTHQAEQAKKETHRASARSAGRRAVEPDRGRRVRSRSNRIRHTQYYNFDNHPRSRGLQRTPGQRGNEYDSMVQRVVIIVARSKLCYWAYPVLQLRKKIRFAGTSGMLPIKLTGSVPGAASRHGIEVVVLGISYFLMMFSTAAHRLLELRGIITTTSSPGVPRK